MSTRRGVGRAQDQRILIGRVRKWERKQVPAEGSKTRAQLLLMKWMATGSLYDVFECPATRPAAQYPHNTEDKSVEKSFPLHPQWSVLTRAQRPLPTCEGGHRKEADNLKRRTSTKGALDLLGEEEEAEAGRATPLPGGDGAPPPPGAAAPPS